MGSEAAIGFVSCLISCVAFGFMFAPLKKFPTKDGFFVQWVQCAVVFVVGFFINFARGFPPFNPVATVGGVLFATGNVASVPLVNGLGIGLGMLIWGSVQVTVGWCVARFGLFGTNPQPVYNNAMNIAGLLLTLISGTMFVFVKHNSAGTAQPTVSDAEKSDMEVEEERRTADRSSTDGFHIGGKKLLLIALAVFLGILHGLMMTPIVYIMDTDKDASKSESIGASFYLSLLSVLDYVFAHFCAIFAFSTIYFIIYCIYRKNRPYISPDLLPSTIGVLADVFLFKTITGKKNLMLMSAGVSVALSGVVLIAISNQNL
ncbi:Transmembrane protein [Toxocara canis]|uniref:Transmembrane protein n=1 Tax=Toxocara canis TaxID=6265 RepID=A0A0B2VEZ7_TOXCA|nr:Transmembrane protein [Toxocara canis]